jgi:hypothetical protein
MKKLLTTLVTFAALLFGSLAIVAPIQAAVATECSTDNPGTPDDPCGPPPCTTDNPGTTDDPCTPVPDEPAPVPCPTVAKVSDASLADTEARLVAVTAKADRLQAVADRRAATIQRLRAKIRALR